MRKIRKWKYLNILNNSRNNIGVYWQITFYFTAHSRHLKMDGQYQSMSSCTSKIFLFFAAVTIVVTHSVWWMKKFTLTKLDTGHHGLLPMYYCRPHFLLVSEEFYLVCPIISKKYYCAKFIVSDLICFLCLGCLYIFFSATFFSSA